MRKFYDINQLNYTKLYDELKLLFYNVHGCYDIFNNSFKFFNIKGNLLENLFKKSLKKNTSKINKIHHKMNKKIKFNLF